MINKHGRETPDGWELVTVAATEERWLIRIFLFCFFGLFFWIAATVADHRKVCEKRCFKSHIYTFRQANDDPSRWFIWRDGSKFQDTKNVIEDCKRQGIEYRVVRREVEESWYNPNDQGTDNHGIKGQ